MEVNSQPISRLNQTGIAATLSNHRICLVAGTLGQGGAERQLFYIAKALKDSGTHILVLCLTQGELWESRLQGLGIQVKYVGSSASRLARLAAVFKAVDRFRPIIVQSQHFYTNGYAAVAAKLICARSIGAIRNDGFSDLQDCAKPFRTICLRLPHFLGVNSRAAIGNLVKMGCNLEKLKHLPNVVDTDRFAPSNSRRYDCMTILGIGRLVPQKRFDRFLRILTLLRQSTQLRFRALIAGEGPLRTELEEWARRYGLLPNSIEFCGNAPDVQQLYTKADILLLTSDHEGTPNVVMEAMASSLPVVATAVGDVPDLVQNGSTGFVVQPNDEMGAAKCLAKLMQDDIVRKSMGRRGREFIYARHSLGCLPVHLSDLYSKALP